ncbi:MAG TPA: hypothetical protein VHB22_07060 [Hyphomicrobium sp.]|nr:hypothetical protein [Hyphomicrobium sp.]
MQRLADGQSFHGGEDDNASSGDAGAASKHMRYWILRAERGVFGIQGGHCKRLYAVVIGTQTGKKLQRDNYEFYDTFSIVRPLSNDADQGYSG